MLREFLFVATLQPPWIISLMVLVAVVWVLLTWLTVVLVSEAVQTWRGDRRRQRQVTDEALRYAEQRALQQRIRGLVDDERRRQQLTAALHTHRSSRSGEPQ